MSTELDLRARIRAFVVNSADIKIDFAPDTSSQTMMDTVRESYPLHYSALVRWVEGNSRANRFFINIKDETIHGTAFAGPSQMKFYEIREGEEPRSQDLEELLAKTLR